jgi:transcriptional regulator with XRE-family HTH domain
VLPLRVKGMKRASLYSADHRVLIQLLKDLRLEAGLSQTAVAAALKRPQTYVSAVEVGQRGLDLLQVRELAGAYGLPFLKFAALLEDRLKRRTYRPPRLVREDAVTAKRPPTRDSGRAKKKR